MRANKDFFVSCPGNQRVDNMGIKMSPKMLSDGYVKYEEAEVHRSAIMQDFQDNRKNNLKWPTGGHFGFY